MVTAASPRAHPLARTRPIAENTRIGDQKNNPRSTLNSVARTCGEPNVKDPSGYELTIQCPVVHLYSSSWGDTQAAAIASMPRTRRHRCWRRSRLAVKPDQVVTP